MPYRNRILHVSVAENVSIVLFMLMMLSLSVVQLRQLLDFCTACGNKFNILFNAAA